MNQSVAHTGGSECKLTTDMQKMIGKVATRTNRIGFLSKANSINRVPTPLRQKSIYMSGCFYRGKRSTYKEINPLHSPHRKGRTALFFSRFLDRWVLSLCRVHRRFEVAGASSTRCSFDSASLEFPLSSRSFGVPDPPVIQTSLSH